MRTLSRVLLAAGAVALAAGSAWAQAETQPGADPPVAKELNITAEQRVEFRKAAQGSFAKLGEVFRESKGDREQIEKRLGELNKKAMEDVVKSLTEEQRTKWREMIGEPFKGTL